MDNKKDHLEQLSQDELIRFLVNAFRLSILHYGFWFNEIQHQLGTQEAIYTEEEVSKKIFPIVINRLSKALGFEIKDELPLFFINMPREKLIGLIDAMSVNWLANDGTWFQTVEDRHDMYTSKRCNDTCWTRFSPSEAKMIKSLLNIPELGGIESLKRALNYRLYARLNKQTAEEQGEGLIFKMITCRVQEARNKKGLEDYPCKSAGLVEYGTFAQTIDPRIKTECLGCPPDQHPEEWTCAWRFYLT